MPAGQRLTCRCSRHRHCHCHHFLHQHHHCHRHCFCHRYRHTQFVRHTHHHHQSILHHVKVIFSPMVEQRGRAKQKTGFTKKKYKKKFSRRMKNIFPKSAAVLSSTLTSQQKLRFDNPPHNLSFKYSPDILKRIILFTIPNHQISFLIIRYNSQSSDTVQKMVEEPMPRDPKQTSRFKKQTKKTSRFKKQTKKHPGLRSFFLMILTNLQPMGRAQGESETKDR